MNKVELQFMVVPELLAEYAYVPDAVRCKVVDPDAIFLTGILGESGKETVSACQSCEDFIHSTWTHNELRDIYNNVETIVSNEKFSNFLKWLLKQPKDTVFKSCISNNRTHKGKYK